MSRPSRQHWGLADAFVNFAGKGRPWDERGGAWGGVRLFFRPIWIHLITLSFFRELSWTFLQWKIERERERERKFSWCFELLLRSSRQWHFVRRYLCSRGEWPCQKLSDLQCTDVPSSTWRHGGLHKFWYPWVPQNGTIYLNGHMYIYIYTYIYHYIYIIKCSFYNENSYQNGWFWGCPHRKPHYGPRAWPPKSPRPSSAS